MRGRWCRSRGGETRISVQVRRTRPPTGRICRDRHDCSSRVAGRLTILSITWPSSTGSSCAILRSSLRCVSAQRIPCRDYGAAVAQDGSAWFFPQTSEARFSRSGFGGSYLNLVWFGVWRHYIGVRIVTPSVRSIDVLDRTSLRGRAISRNRRGTVSTCRLRKTMESRSSD